MAGGAPAWQGVCVAGACMVGGMQGGSGGHAFLGGVHGGGMHGRGAYTAGGCAWQGVNRFGCTWQGACVVRGDKHGRRDGHCSGWFTSYCNAFLFYKEFTGSNLMKSEVVSPDTSLTDKLS